VTVPDPVTAVLAQLDALRDTLYDPDRAMLHVAPGAIGGATGTGLHPTRETALDALRRLQLGDDTTAAVELAAVCDLQYRDAAHDGRPWAGTFKVMAEHPDPPASGGWEWVHWDPNWRQFLGAVLAQTMATHGDRLPDALRRRGADACAAAVRGEPDGRIAEDYTNPALLHAWLRAHVGDDAGDDRGTDAAHRQLARLRAAGDVDEYNSPTYDGVDLWAAALWQAFPPDDVFATGGAEIAAAIGRRLSQVYHPGLGVVCGPYVRAYGVDLRASVTLGALWLLLAGAPRDDVLPPTLDAATDHVHDLFFLPAFTELAGYVTPHLHVQPVARTRRHEQRFGDVHAVHVLTPDTAVGAESGRRPTTAHHQYVPVTAHWRDPVGGGTVHCALQCGFTTAGVDAVHDEDTTVRFRAVAFDDAGAVSLVVHTSDGAVVDGSTVTVGAATLDFDAAPTVQRSAAAGGERIECRWERAVVSGRLHLSLP
jgi:hypothetical protein